MKDKFKYSIILLVAAAAALFVASFIKSDPAHEMRSEAESLERSLQRREAILDRYCEAVLSGRVQLRDEADLPEDMVIYHYKGDTLHCWINQFPISNDAIKPNPGNYRLHHLFGPDVAYTSPLAYLTSDQAYINLGTSWYYIKNYSQDGDRMIAAILIKNEYPQESLRSANKINPHLKLESKYTTAPLSIGSGAIVHSSAGKPLFSVVETSGSHYSYGYYPLHWTVILLLVAAAFLLHMGLRNRRSFIVYAVVITLLAARARSLAHICDPSGPFFSPLTYAGNSLLDSLASLLMVNSYLFLISMGLFLLRAQLLDFYRHLSKTGRLVSAAASVAALVFLAVYINFALRSLIYNSNITLNLANITRVNIYSIICLVSFGLLFVALLHALQMCITTIRGKRKPNLYSWKYLLFYILAVALYTSLTIYSTSLRKEYNSNKVWTDKLSVDRDLSLEMQLRMIESSIKGDQIIALMSFYPNGGGDIIRNRILERYLFRSFSSRYNLSVTSCGAATALIIDRNTPAVDCYSFYADELAKYGIQLAPGSSFFFMNNYNGKTSYLGVFTYVNYDTLQSTNLYLEISSRVASDKETSMTDILLKQSADLQMPADYSYAKYSAGRLVSYSGRGTFPSRISTDSYRAGYHMRRNGNNIEFVNKVSDDDVVIISRPVRGILQHLILFSYLLLLFALIIASTTTGLRKSKLFTMPPNSYKRRITLLMILSTFFALGCVGVGTIWFTIDRNKRVNERNMVRNIEIVQSTLSDYCQYALRYTDVNTPQMQEAMKTISGNTGNEINIFDTHGLLVATTQPDLYNQAILGNRMDHAAYRAIVEESYMNYIGTESVAGSSFQSIYAPLYNIDGEMVAIANIPHVTGQTRFQEEGAMIVSSIINLYLIILILSIIASLMMAGNISRPLTEIRSYMERLPGSKKKEHLEYKEGKDEIGLLVGAYNRMVDELDESTRRLARTERESAWKEMARQIAHEIKNPLTPMQLSIQHVQRLKRDNAPGWQDAFDKLSRSLLEQIEILSRTASDFSTLSKLLADEQVSHEDLVTILSQEMVLFRGNENVSVEFASTLESAPVQIRKQQIIRAFVNLITNAMQALEKTGGRVLVSLEKDGEGYRVSVDDNGGGVKDEFVDKLFSPNFTTKVGGSGLGLAICKDIIEQNGGRISYERSPRLGGASFVVRLPAA